MADQQQQEYGSAFMALRARLQSQRAAGGGGASAASGPGNPPPHPQRQFRFRSNANDTAQTYAPPTANYTAPPQTTGGDFSWANVGSSPSSGRGGGGGRRRGATTTRGRGRRRTTTRRGRRNTTAASNGEAAEFFPDVPSDSEHNGGQRARGRRGGGNAGDGNSNNNATANSVGSYILEQIRLNPSMHKDDIYKWRCVASRGGRGRRASMRRTLLVYEDGQWNSYTGTEAHNIWNIVSGKVTVASGGEGGGGGTTLNSSAAAARFGGSTAVLQAVNSRQSRLVAIGSSDASGVAPFSRSSAAAAAVGGATAITVPTTAPPAQQSPSASDRLRSIFTNAFKRDVPSNASSVPTLGGLNRNVPRTAAALTVVNSATAPASSGANGRPSNSALQTPTAAGRGGATRGRGRGGGQAATVRGGRTGRSAAAPSAVRGRRGLDEAESMLPPSEDDDDSMLPSSSSEGSFAFDDDDDNLASFINDGDPFGDENEFSEWGEAIDDDDADDGEGEWERLSQFSDVDVSTLNIAQGEANRAVPSQNKKNTAVLLIDDDDEDDDYRCRNTKKTGSTKDNKEEGVVGVSVDAVMVASAMREALRQQTEAIEVSRRQQQAEAQKQEAMLEAAEKRLMAQVRALKQEPADDDDVVPQKASSDASRTKITSWDLPNNAAAGKMEPLSCVKSEKIDDPAFSSEPIFKPPPQQVAVKQEFGVPAAARSQPTAPATKKQPSKKVEIFEIISSSDDEDGDAGNEQQRNAHIAVANNQFGNVPSAGVANSLSNPPYPPTDSVAKGPEQPDSHHTTNTVAVKREREDADFDMLLPQRQESGLRLRRTEPHHQHHGAAANGAGECVKDDGCIDAVVSSRRSAFAARLVGGSSAASLATPALATTETTPCSASAATLPEQAAMEQQRNMSSGNNSPITAAEVYNASAHAVRVKSENPPPLPPRPLAGLFFVVLKSLQSVGVGAAESRRPVTTPNNQQAVAESIAAQHIDPHSRQRNLSALRLVGRGVTSILPPHSVAKQQHPAPSPPQQQQQQPPQPRRNWGPIGTRTLGSAPASSVGTVDDDGGSAIDDMPLAEFMRQVNGQHQQAALAGSVPSLASMRPSLHHHALPTTATTPITGTVPLAVLDTRYANNEYDGDVGDGGVVGIDDMDEIVGGYYGGAI